MTSGVVPSRVALLAIRTSETTTEVTIKAAETGDTATRKDPATGGETVRPESLSGPARESTERFTVDGIMTGMGVTMDMLPMATVSGPGSMRQEVSAAISTGGVERNTTRVAMNRVRTTTKLI